MTWIHQLKQNGQNVVGSDMTVGQLVCMNLDSTHCTEVPDDLVGRIVYAEDLTLDVALRALRGRATAVLTSRGSRYSHAAIVLASSSKIRWFSGVEKEALPEAGNLLAVPQRGWTEPIRQGSPAQAAGLEGETVQCLDRGDWLTCPHPERRYDPLAGPLIARAIGRSLRQWGAANCSGYLADDGRMWFRSSAPFRTEIQAAALNDSHRRSFLTHQAHYLDQLVASAHSWDEGQSLESAIRAIGDFFVNTVLTHWDYELILTNKMSQLGYPRRASVVSLWSSMSLVNWLRISGVQIPPTKVLAPSRASEISVPPGSCGTDLAVIKQKILESGYPHDEANVVLDICQLIVTKEWKHVLIHVLLGHVSRALFPSVDPYNDLVEAMKEVLN